MILRSLRCLDVQMLQFSEGFLNTSFDAAKKTLIQESEVLQLETLTALRPSRPTPPGSHREHAAKKASDAPRREFREKLQGFIR